MANAALNTFCSSVAWLLVRLPLETCDAIRLSILDFRSVGDELLDEALEALDEALALPLCREESMLFRAEESAL